MSGKGRGGKSAAGKVAGLTSPLSAASPAPANMRLRKVGGRVARWYCSWCATSSVSPTVVEQHEEKEH